MKLTLPKTIINKIVKAVAEFDLIQDGDRILVGLSGGKDSAFLLYALTILKKNLAVNFDLAALTVDYGFADKGELSSLKTYTHKLGCNFFVEKTRIAEYIQDEDVTNPCARCALFRKGAMANFMQKHGFNKIAYGHHYDDAVETFLMSILYSGQLLTLQPERYLSRNNISIIRPLIYLKEKQIASLIQQTGFKPIASPCPYNGQTKREEMKKVIREFTASKQIFYNLVAAMREGAPKELWPELPPRKELTNKMNLLWGKDYGG